MVPESPSEAIGRTIETPTGPVYVIDEGDGPPLLSVHGVPGSVRDFRWLASVVEGPLRFIRCDLPGYARTPLETMPGLTFAERADFVVALADALGLERFALIGHSMGGAISMHAAARHPDRVAGVALACSVGLRVHKGYRDISGTFKTLSPLLRYIPGMKWMMGSTLQKGFAKAGFSKQLTVEECVHSVHLVATLDFASINEAVPQVKAPVLISWSEDDPFIEPEIPVELGKVVPDGPRIPYPTGGHNIQKHQAVELGAALIEWMGSLSL